MSHKARTRKLKRRRSDQLLAVLRDYDNIAIVTHDNPDPDAIPAGWAVHKLILKSLKQEPQLIGGGDVVRAENRHMMNLVQPPIELVHRFLPEARTAAVLVDCGPKVAGHLLNSPKIETVAVIDHHLTGELPELPFVDIRPKMAACATMTADYLREQKISPGERLATALLYAIRTETCGNEFHHTPLDRSIILWLTNAANPRWLAEIDNAPLAQTYYGDLTLALQQTIIFGDTAFCLLPQAQGQEIVGEVADLLIRGEGITRVFCGAAIGGDLFCSVRTQSDTDNAARLVQATLNGLGNGGGHAHRAGGKVTNIADNGPKESVESKLKERWLQVCEVQHNVGRKLVGTL